MAVLLGHAQGTVTSRYIHTVDTALIMAADAVAGYIQGLLDGVQFKRSSYALDCTSYQATMKPIVRRSYQAACRADRGMNSGIIAPTKNSKKAAHAKERLQ